MSKEVIYAMLNLQNFLTVLGKRGQNTIGNKIIEVIRSKDNKFVQKNPKQFDLYDLTDYAVDVLGEDETIDMFNKIDRVAGFDRRAHDPLTVFTPIKRKTEI